jgi:hypothetical protein
MKTACVIFPFRLTLYSQSIWKSKIKYLTATEVIKKLTHLHSGEFIDKYVFLRTDLMASMKLNAHRWKTNRRFVQKVIFVRV